MGYLKEVNIKYDMPASDLAVRRATYAIENGRTLGASAVKLIHGYGSRGQGGKKRVERRAYPRGEQESGPRPDYIPGERFSIFDEATRRAFAHCDELRRDRDLEASNNGMTVVIL